MKGGYFVLDCRNHQPAADGSHLVINDEEFKKDFIAASKSGKPVLFTNFRTGHGPNFGEIYRSDSDIKGSVSGVLEIDSRVINYIWVYDESVNEFFVMMKIYDLSN